MTDLNRRPSPEREPNQLRRLDGEQMRERDAQVAKMLRAHVPYRTIAARLGCSLGSVQQTVARIRAGVPPGARRERKDGPAPQHASRSPITFLCNAIGVAAVPALR